MSVNVYYCIYPNCSLFIEPTTDPLDSFQVTKSATASSQQVLNCNIVISFNFILTYVIFPVHYHLLKLKKVINEKLEVSPYLRMFPFSLETSETREFNKILNQLDCFTKQYNRYKITVLDEFVRQLRHIIPKKNYCKNNLPIFLRIQLDGKLTLKENLADYLGITFAFRAYQSYVAHNGEESRLPGLEQFSPEQIFFISFATSFCTKYANDKILDITMKHDEHTVAPYRVIGALSNLHAFSAHFKCRPRNSPMNPFEKCTLDQLQHFASFSATQTNKRTNDEPHIVFHCRF